MYDHQGDARSLAHKAKAKHVTCEEIIQMKRILTVRVFLCNKLK